MKNIKKVITYIDFKFCHLLNIVKNVHHTYYCSVCEKKVFYFLALPELYKNELFINNQIFSYQNAETLNYTQYSCPKCGASDRERLYALFINTYLIPLNEIKKMKIVHFAPEHALRQFLIKLPFLQYRTADLMMNDVDDQIDLTNLHIYPESSFDFFICSHMLEHIADDKKALSELFRILKPGGKGILMVPILLGLDKTYEDCTIITEEERLKHFGQKDHVRVYSKQDYMDLLLNANFAVKEYTVHNFIEKEFLRYGITLQSTLYLVEKN